MRRERLVNRLVLLVMMVSVCATAASAEDPSIYFEKLKKFDISIEIVDPRFDKKVGGIEHRKAFTALIGLPDRAQTLERVESEQASSKERLAALDAMIESSAEAPPEGPPVEKLARQALEGDAAALERLRTLGVVAIPALVRLKDEKATVPSPEIIELLALLEARADEAVEKDGRGLDAPTLKILAAREKSYAAILKRAAIALEGTRRPYPHWLPFVYMYGLGFIPFLFGIVASFVYYGGFRLRIMALIAGIYVFYVCFIGFFQFFAPWIG